MSNNTKYKGKYYTERHQKTVHAANEVLAHVLERLPEVASAVDFGCGVGTWLSTLSRYHGVGTVLGLDGDWVKPELLEIPEESFQVTDLSKPLVLAKKYDLALSLEVAEHLPPESAAGFVESICKASDHVLFSAAIPGQGGQGHVNMQWPGYWAGLFAGHGYECLDIIREAFWEDSEIPVWYRQNCLLFVNKEALGRVLLKGGEGSKVGRPVSLVHPEFFLSKIRQFHDRESTMATLSGSARLLFRAFKRSLRKMLAN